MADSFDVSLLLISLCNKSASSAHSLFALDTLSSFDGLKFNPTSFSPKVNCLWIAGAESVGGFVSG